MRLADGTVAIPPILIGTHASRIREIGALALAAATIDSPKPQLNLGSGPRLTTNEVAVGATVAGRQRQDPSQ